MTSFQTLLANRTVMPGVTSGGDILLEPYERNSDEIKAQSLLNQGFEVSFTDINYDNSPDIVNIIDRSTQYRTIPQSDESLPDTVTSLPQSIQELESSSGYSGSTINSTEFISKILPQFDQVYKYATQANKVTPFLSSLFQRWQEYESLSPLSKNLMNLLYGNVIEYVKRPPGTGHPLEYHIITFEQIMDDEALIRALGYRIGLYIPIDRDYSALEIFIDKLVEFIENYEKYAPDEAKYPGIPSTSEIINMNRPQFDKFLSDNGIKISNDEKERMFQDRLLTFMTFLQTKPSSS